MTPIELYRRIEWMMFVRFVRCSDDRAIAVSRRTVSLGLQDGFPLEICSLKAWEEGLSLGRLCF